MADFNAVIRRAVDGLSNNTPEMRARVYEKARAAVLRQLENMSPRPPEHMLQRQMEKLDAAIRLVEAEHSENSAPEPIEAVSPPAAPVQAPAAIEVAPPQPAMPTAAIPAELMGAAPAEQNETEPQPAVWQEPTVEVVPEERGAHAPAWEETREPETFSTPPAPSFTPEQAPDVVHEDWEPVSATVPENDYGHSYEQPYEVTDRVQQTAHDDVVTVAEPVATHEAVYEALPESGIEAEAVESEPVHEPVFDAPAVLHDPIDEVQAAPQDAIVEEAVSYQPSQPASWEDAITSHYEPAPSVEQPQAVIEPEPEPIAVAPEPVIEAPVEPVEQPAVSAVVPDAVDDWLRSSDTYAEPPVVNAILDMPGGNGRISNRVPELPEIDIPPSVASYTPTDEFPAYIEPAPTNTMVDPLVEAGISAENNAAPAVVQQKSDAIIEPDDFSQWFQDGDTAQTAGKSETGRNSDDGWDEDFAAFTSPASTGVASEGLENLARGYDKTSYRLEPKPRRRLEGIVVGILVLSLLGGIGYGGWRFKDDAVALIDGLTKSEPVTNEAGLAPETEDVKPATGAETSKPVVDSKPVAPEDKPAAPEEKGPAKYTQRLLADGSEVDAGAGTLVGGGAMQEGRSVSPQTVASTVEPTDPPKPQTSTTTPASASTGLAGGEKLFLYEERIGQATPVAVPGTVTWSAVRETGSDGRPDPQIQARLNIPDRGLSALVTFKRNNDSSLPASHIIEVVFSLPSNFEGGTVDNLQRIALKRTEQDRGDPLVAVTAKVTDDTYLVALNDFDDVVKRNMELLSTRGWIDIPVTYRNGRRALLTLDKGTAGATIFGDVMREWAADSAKSQ